MKLIIDIPEKIEEYIKDYIPIGAGNNVFCYPDEIVRAIQNGTPIPDNATVCDIEQIRAEIEQRMQVKPKDFNQHDESDYDRGLYTALAIIDKHTKGEANEVN